MADTEIRRALSGATLPTGETMELTVQVRPRYRSARNGEPFADRPFTGLEQARRHALAEVSRAAARGDGADYTWNIRVHVDAWDSHAGSFRIGFARWNARGTGTATARMEPKAPHVVLAAGRTFGWFSHRGPDRAAGELEAMCIRRGWDRNGAAEMFTWLDLHTGRRTPVQHVFAPEPDCVKAAHDWREPPALQGLPESISEERKVGRRVHPDRGFEWQWTECCAHCGRYRTRIWRRGDFTLSHREPDADARAWLHERNGSAPPREPGPDRSPVPSETPSALLLSERPPRGGW